MNRLILPALLLTLMVASCSREKSNAELKRDSGPVSSVDSASSRAGAMNVRMQRPLDLPGLHNVVLYVDGVYSGGVPEGDEGFATLKELGVRTILSVDGAQPDVDRARKAGMRYVHLPIGYNGMERSRTLEIARVIRDLPHPIYIHCHHGQHRSAAAAGAGLVTLGRLTNEHAVERMKVSGTSPNYPGLYQCVNVALVVSDAEVNRASSEFPARWKTSDFVEAMVEIDDAFDHLKLIEKAGWKTPKDHPDLVPAAEAGRLADYLRNLKDDEYVRKQPEEFGAMLMNDVRTVSQLEEALVAGNVAKERLSEYFAAVGKSCKDCHVKYRNDPAKKSSRIFGSKTKPRTK